jgi:hypothetical protein
MVAIPIERCPAIRIRRRTVADAGAIPIYSVLKLTDPNTAAVSAADNDVFAGIALQEKVANDGIVEISVACGGKWQIASTAAAITAGALVSIGGAETVVTADAAAVLAGQVVGKSLNTVGGGGGNMIIEVGESC